MKIKFYILLIFNLVIWSTNVFSQTYYPLPSRDSDWTVFEFDEFTGRYASKIYTVEGDTLINGTSYTKVYQLSGYPTVYDTVKRLHCLMRQDNEGKKIWFIRHYLCETSEKLGYDLSVSEGDTVCLPALSYPFEEDSVFIIGFVHPHGAIIIDGSFRTSYSMISANTGRTIEYIEGVTCLGNTFPDRYFYWDPFHQSYTHCAHQNNAYIWPANITPLDTTQCGFTVGFKTILTERCLQVNPNPADNFCILELPNYSPNTELSIINYLGELVLNIRTVTTDKLNLDISNYPSGLYIIQLKTPMQTYTKKLIVKHSFQAR